MEHTTGPCGAAPLPADPAAHGWRDFAHELPRPMSGRVQVSHPDWKGATRVEFVGTRPRDFREDGYRWWTPASPARAEARA